MKNIHDLSNQWRIGITIIMFLIILLLLYLSFQIVAVTLMTFIAWMWKDFLNVDRVAGFGQSRIEEVIVKEKDVGPSYGGLSSESHDFENKLAEIKNVIELRNNNAVVDINFIANLLGLPRRTVKGHLEKLVKEGFLEKMYLPGKSPYYLLVNNKDNQAVDYIISKKSNEGINACYKFIQFRGVAIDAVVETNSNIYLIEIKHGRIINEYIKREMRNFNNKKRLLKRFFSISKIYSKPIVVIIGVVVDSRKDNSKDMEQALTTAQSISNSEDYSLELQFIPSSEIK
jgi:predicted transcriptional regulator